MKKKSYIGTLNTGYFAGNVCRGIEIKTRQAITPEDLKTIIKGVFDAVNTPIKSSRLYTTADYGLSTLHYDIQCSIAPDKMPDFLKAARAAGLKIGV